MNGVAFGHRLHLRCVDRNGSASDMQRSNLLMNDACPY